MKITFFILRFFLIIFLFFLRHIFSDEIIISTKQIIIPGFEKAYNPSLVKNGKEFILSFRFTPDTKVNPFLSLIGLLTLDENFHINSLPQFLNTDLGIQDHQFLHSEDARLVTIDQKIYIVFNDCKHKDPLAKREMFIGQIKQNSNGNLNLYSKLKLTYPKYSSSKWEKNWFPFDYCSEIFLGYSVGPLEIIKPNLTNGFCKLIASDTYDTSFWNYGSLRGGTNAIKLENSYLSIFHSSIKQFSDCSLDKERFHYYIGAFLFEDTPPFKIKKISKEPITHPSFYKSSDAEKRVIFPGGIIKEGNHLYMAYGRDDREIWIAKINIEALIESLEDPIR